MTIKNSLRQNLSCQLLSLLAMLLVLSITGTSFAARTGPKQKSFHSPAEAVRFLYEAVKNGDNSALTLILGPGAEKIINSGDPVADKADREHFLALYGTKNRLEKKGNSRAVLFLGSDDFPFPLPLVRKGGGWRFDTRAGTREILTRRIGKNELAVMDVLNSYLDAQREYARKDHDSNGVLEFASRLSSSPGKQDGLFWETKDGAETSPLGPLVARADCEGYGAGFLAPEPEPFHGYYFKLLTAQGKNAEGGAFDYLVNGKMVLGFALLAYPAGYRSSGVMTFMVNQGGFIYEKDLGKETARLARQITSFDPDKSWKRVEP